MIKQAVVAVSVGVAIGAAGGWWHALPPQPWLSFQALTATYKSGGQEIVLEGHYVVFEECDGDADVIWRTEAIATDGQLAVYGPKPGMPPLTIGRHTYASSIPLLERIQPDGWVVRIIVTCPGEKPETVVSPAAVVEVLPRAGGVFTVP